MITTISKSTHLKIHSMKLKSGRVLSVEADTEVLGNQQIESALTLVLDGLEFADMDLTMMLDARTKSNDTFEATKPRLKILKHGGVEGYDKNTTSSARLSIEERDLMLSLSRGLFGALSRDRGFLMNQCRHLFDQAKFNKPLENEFKVILTNYLENSIKQAA